MDEGKKIKVPLQEEIDFVSKYVEVQSVRFNNKIKISFTVQGNFAHKTIAPLLLLPIIENTFKHGIEDEIMEGYIAIEISLFNDTLMLTARNSKIKWEKDIGARKGIGLENVKKRLALLYPDKYKIDLVESINEYKITLTINLQ
jgi:LytS/YehU family sensor histidine kinase